MRYVRPRLEMCCAGTGMVGVSHELPVGGVLLPTQWDCGTSPARGSLAIVVADNEGAELGVSPVLPGGFGAPGMPSSSGTGAGVSDSELPVPVLAGGFGFGMLMLSGTGGMSSSGLPAPFWPGGGVSSSCLPAPVLKGGFGALGTPFLSSTGAGATSTGFPAPFCQVVLVCLARR